MKTMNEREFRALISLLDDEDPVVSTEVWGTLMSMGKDGVNRLENAWETEDDPELQRKIAEVIHLITLKGITNDLLSWRREGGQDLLLAWFLITRIQYPELDYTVFKNEINRLVNKTWLEINDKMSPHEKLKVLSHILFSLEGYRPNKEKPELPDNYFLNQVIEHKKGNFISLNLLYQVVCEKLDLPVSGVLLPGYYVLIFFDGNTEFFIDVFNGGVFFSRKDLERFLSESKIPEKPSYFKPTSHIYTILQLMRYLANEYRKNGKPEKANEVEKMLEEIDIRFD